MALSPSHRFGQIIGDLLEEVMGPQLQYFCAQRNLYLDRKGTRGSARDGKKVSWIDKYGNSHDLDFVIEKGGTSDIRGRPLAFIEAAWRRYTKHSRNKAQEIQGAVLPIAEKYDWDKPFLGVILAGVFTSGSLTQMKSSGFEVALFPYETIVKAFLDVNIDVSFDEDTLDSIFIETITKILSLDDQKRQVLKDRLIHYNNHVLEKFFIQLQKAIDRHVYSVLVIPLHGSSNDFGNVADAISFINSYNESNLESGLFRKYELIVRYSNDDKIDASFQDKNKAIAFLDYINKGAES